jgi:uncharacterized protein YcfJ
MHKTSLKGNIMKKLMIVVVMMTLSVPAMADTGGGVLGALIGGAIGNQVGGGNGKNIATLVGVIAGANIGSRVEDGTYGKDADGYARVNCGTAYTQQQYDQNPGATAAAARGMSDRKAMEQRYLEQRAYCNQNPYGCGGGYNGGYNYSGSYYNRNQNIQWR